MPADPKRPGPFPLESHGGGFREPIRVLRLLSRMNVGGPSLHVLHLTRGLQELGYQTRLAVGLPQPIEGSMVPLARAAGVEVTLIPGLDRPIHPFRDLRAFFGILNQIREFRPHIVDTHTAKAGILGRLAAIQCGVPVIVHTFHGHVFEGYFPPMVSRTVVALERFLARWTDLIITLTPGLRQDLLHHLRPVRPDKVRVVPLGLDLAELSAIPRRSGGVRQELGLEPSDLLVGMVARLVPVKNHLQVLEVFRRLAGMIPRLHLGIVGGGEMEDEIRRTAAELGLTGRVHLCGIRERIAPVYADLDLLIMASHNEGTPVVLIEGLAAGCPVAATPVGGVRELLEEGRLGAILRRDTPGMTADLERVLRDLPQRLERAQAFRAETVQRFSIPRLLARTAEEYRAVLARKGSRTALGGRSGGGGVPERLAWRSPRGGVR